MTRQQILDLKIGDVLERCLEARNKQPTPDARWTFKGAVTEITFRGFDVKGRAYVGFYTMLGNGAMSGSITEGEGHVRFAES